MLRSVCSRSRDLTLNFTTILKYYVKGRQTNGTFLDCKNFQEVGKVAHITHWLEWPCFVQSAWHRAIRSSPNSCSEPSPLEAPDISWKDTPPLCDGVLIISLCNFISRVEKCFLCAWQLINLSSAAWGLKCWHLLSCSSNTKISTVGSHLRFRALLLTSSQLLPDLTLWGGLHEVSQ